MAGAVLLLRPAFPPGAAGYVLPWSAGERPRYFEEDPQEPAVGSHKEPRRRSYSGVRCPCDSPLPETESKPNRGTDGRFPHSVLLNECFLRHAL
jgi:hypothetical protein